MKNTGNTVWQSSQDNEFKLVLVTGSADVIYPDWNSSQIYLSNSVEPGQTSDIEFYLSAPVNPSSIYTLQWIMKKNTILVRRQTRQLSELQETVQGIWILSLTMLPLWNRVSNSMILNESQDISVTVSNTGTNTWKRDREQVVMIDAKSP
ncbi:MAG: hypothetical protein IPH77_17440 [Ignavibacteria bacterium]|nr:hypothetical protein [Ignavibacteria bacterium]